MGLTQRWHRIHDGSGVVSGDNGPWSLAGSWFHTPVPTPAAPPAAGASSDFRVRAGTRAEGQATGRGARLVRAPLVSQDLTVYLCTHHAAKNCVRFGCPKPCSLLLFQSTSCRQEACSTLPWGLSGEATPCHLHRCSVRIRWRGHADYC